MTREVTTAGVSVKTVDEIRSDLADAIQAKPSFGPTAQVHPYSVLGQLIDAIASEEVSLDELMTEVVAQLDPDTATGVFLEAHAKAVGIAGRKAATESTATLTITGTPAVVVPAGTRYRVPDGPIFETDEAATIAGGGTVDVGVTCTVTGPEQALTGTITEIVDSVAGVTSVTNAADASLGTDEETDPELRSRRGRSLSAAGNTTRLALRAELEDIESVSYAEVIVNDSLTTDSDGIPGKAIRPVIWPDTADTDDVALAIFNGAAAGIYIDGTETATVTDNHDVEQTVRWKFADELELNVRVVVTTNINYPSSGDDDIADAVLAYCQTLKPSENVYPHMIKSVIILGGEPLDIDCDPVPGIETITVRVRMGADPVTGFTDPIDVGVDEISIADSARIVVVST